MQNSTLVWIIVAALVVLGGGWYFFSQSAPATPQEEGETVSENEGTGVGSGAGVGVDVEVGTGTGGGNEESAAPMNASVTYSSSGFSPSTVTVKVGGTVTWTNQGGGDMWVASAQHPVHSAYDGTTLQEHCGAGDNAFDQCRNGSTYSFTFTKPGTWRYHNHSQSSHFGTVIVEE